MAMMYLYCDESGKYRKNPIVTIAGVAANRDRIDRFDAEWLALLRSYGLTELHMSRIFDVQQDAGRLMPRGQTIQERAQALIPFADCINKHLEIGLVQAWDVKGYNLIPFEAKKLLGGSRDPHQLAFIRGLLEIVEHLQAEDHLSIICDDDVITAWDSYLHYRAAADAEPKIKQKVVGLTFAHSHFLPSLQAADMVAFLARREARKQFQIGCNEFQELWDYLAMRAQGKDSIMNWLLLFLNEQKLVDLANELESLGMSAGK